MLVKAFAKVNLGLFVGNARTDGYHDVHSVVLSVDLFDLVDVEVKDANEKTAEITVEGCDFVRQEKNTAYAAVRNFLTEFNHSDKSVSVKITKNIPVAAGFGGSSADAAGVLFALAKYFGVDINSERMLAVAAKCGSDVAAMTSGGCVEVLGRGEKVKKLSVDTDFNLVLAVGESCSTAKVFAAFDSVVQKTRDDVSSVKEGLKNGDIKRIAAAIKNDLTLPCLTVYPRQKKFICDCEKIVGIAPILSGSGGGVFWLTDNFLESERVCNLLTTKCVKAYICKGVDNGVETVETDLKN